MYMLPPGTWNAAAAETIRWARKLKRLTQTGLGDLVGLTRREISSIETGETTVSLEEGIVLGLALGFKPPEFIEIIWLRARSSQAPSPEPDERTRKLRSIWGID